MHSVRKVCSRVCYCAAALMIFLCFWLTPMETEAASVSLSLICKEDTTVLPGIDWKLYRVGYYDNSGTLVLTGDFANYPIDCNLNTTAKVQDAADTLANFASVDALVPLASGTTNKGGVVTFTSLQTGVYLIKGSPVVIDNKRYTPSATLLNLTIEEGKTEYNWDAYPKFTVKPYSNPSSVTYSVKKQWVNDEGAVSDRPQDLIIQLYCDDVMKREVTLNEANDWSYTWVGSDAEEWHVKELSMPEHYTVAYKQNETVFLIVNTHTGTGSQTIVTNVTKTTYTETTGHGTGTGVIVTGTGTGVVTGTGVTGTGVTGGTGTGIIVTGTGVTGTGVTGGTGTGIVVTGTGSGIATGTGTGVIVTGTGIGTGTGTGVIGTDTTALSGETSTTTGTGETTTSDSTGTTVTKPSQATSSTIGSMTTTTTSTKPTLPATGQLWWPVPCFAAGGLILIGVGWRMDKDKKED